MLKRDLGLPRWADFVWWIAAGILALVSLSVAGLIDVGSDSHTSLVVTIAALFLTGAVIGSLRPDRVWRWPVAAVFAFVLWDCLAAGNDPRFFGVDRPSMIAALLEGNASMYVLHAIPVLVGAYIGAGLLHEGLN